MLHRRSIRLPGSDYSLPGFYYGARNVLRLVVGMKGKKMFVGGADSSHKKPALIPRVNAGSGLFCHHLHQR